MATVTAKLNPALAVDPTTWRAPWIIASRFYLVTFKWDDRATGNRGAWRVTWAKSDGTVLFSGRKLVLTSDFFEPFHHNPDIPPGRLQVRRVDDSEEDPGLYDLAHAIAFDYITED